ncbi:MAG: hypothetical protein L6R37_000880 [Teloschistes peruensis]|nr:MAG: hypothetical protein L6R37_000880 [Teloschistes peruensis]
MAAINENTDGTKGPYGLVPEVSRGMHNALAPSDSLDWMTKTMLTKMGEYLDPLGANPEGMEIDLFKWIRTAFTVVSTEATYGPKNPFNHKPNLGNDFCTSASRAFENDITMILLGVLPSITARKGYQARQRLTKAMTEYFNDNRPETGSDLIRARWAGNVKYNVAQYSGKFEIGDLIAPTKKTTRTLPLSKLKPHCPLLLATYKETLRLQTHNTNTRWVKTTTSLPSLPSLTPSPPSPLTSHYLLIRDSIIQMPGYPVHTHLSVWGTDAQTFNPARFLNNIKGEKKKKEEKYPSSSFRSFGGGATLCPGRHFATAEICAVVAMVVVSPDDI